MRWEMFKFGDLVWLILEILRLFTLNTPDSALENAAIEEVHDLLKTMNICYSVACYDLCESI